MKKEKALDLEKHEIHLIIALLDGRLTRDDRHSIRKIATLRDRLMAACITKQALFADNIAAKYYSQSDETASEFYADAEHYIINSGVPKDRALKLLNKAWEDGHSSGHAEVKQHIDGLIELFK